MYILVIRHAIAEDREVFARTGEDDALRPLTKAGRRKMRRAAAGLRTVVPDLAQIATSPLTRAVETGQILARKYHGVPTPQIPQLAPGKPLADLLSWLQQQPSDAVVALVGHEPHVGLFTSWMLTGLQESFLLFKKGGACMLQCEGEIKPARAKLMWFLKPGQLRSMA